MASCSASVYLGGPLHGNISKGVCEAATITPVGKDWGRRSGKLDYASGFVDLPDAQLRASFSSATTSSSVVCAKSR
jgi:hypothetical protein